MKSVYICSPKRSAVGKYGGGLANIRPDDLLAQILKAVVSEVPSLDVNCIDEVYIGCANQSGEDNRNVARMALLLAGLPYSIPGTTINRLCGSGLDAVGSAFRAIQSGEIEIAIAGGVESMSRAPFVLGKANNAYDRKQTLEDTTMGWRFVNPEMSKRYGTETMPRTAENIAHDFSISRSAQDLFSLKSQQKAQKAQLSGRLAQEITPILIREKKKKDFLFMNDEHPRSETNLETLAKLKPIFENGTVTAGNASGINDGAAAMLVASETAVEKFSLSPIAKIEGMATAGVEPRVMGLGPVPATNKLLDRLHLTLNELDIIELNEAFAAQALACLSLWKIDADDPRLNPNGGAIALGHPLGASGARILISAMHELKIHGKKKALATMCIGVGQGISMIISGVNQ